MVACLQHLPRVLNPFVSPDQAAADLAPLLFTPLVRYADPDGGDAFAPALASSWEWDGDGATVRFRVRDDMLWHDGEPVTAADVVWTIAAAADPEYAYWNASDFTSLSEVTADGPQDVVVRFAEPYGPGLEPFATLPILPRHLLGEVDTETFHQHAYHREPVGSGPFVLSRRAGQNQLVYEANPAYPEALGRSSLQRLLVKEIPEVSTLLVELRTGTTDLCLTGPSAAREARGVASLSVIPAHPGSTQVLLLDHRSPFFDQPEERRALSAAIDRGAIAAVVSPLATPVRTFTPPSWPAPPDSLLVPDAAPVLADSLLSAAGWSTTPGAGARENADGTALEFTVLGPQGYEQVLTVLQAQLARAGMRARTQVMEGSAFIDVVLDPDRRPPAMVLGLTPSRVHAPDPRSSLHSDGATNLGSYRSAVVDSLIDALGRAPAGAAREGLYRALQARIAGDVPVVHLVHLPDVVITGPGIEGVTGGPAGVFASAVNWHRVR
jgi:peptide/nickel transport system substrate-binding protein